MLSAAAPGPALEEAGENGGCGVGVFLDVLNDAVGELLMVETHAFGFVQGDEGADQELQVFLLEGNSKPVSTKHIML